MQECCIFLNAFPSSDRLTLRAWILYGFIEDVGAHSVRPQPSALLPSLRANNVRPYNNVCHWLSGAASPTPRAGSGVLPVRADMELREPHERAGFAGWRLLF